MANELKYIDQGFAVSAITGTIYETTKAEVEPDAGNETKFGSSRPWARWGSDNNYPQRLIDNVMSDSHASLLERRRAMHWGAGLMLCTLDVDDDGNEKVKILPSTKIPKEIKEFFKRNNWNKFQQGIIGDYEWWTSIPVQYIFSNAGKVIEVKWQRRKDVRAELRNPNTGTIENHYLSGTWPDPQQGEYSKIPAIDIFNHDGNNTSGIYVHQLPSIDKDYYPQPGWHGINRPLQVGGKIWRWINANIDNSINFKYHIEIPLDYFLQKCPIEAYKTDAERMMAIQKLENDTYKKIDDYLAGEKNVHKAFYTKIAVDESGKALPGWKINVLENKIQDEAWLRAYGMASMAIVSGIGLNPSLAGITLPNGLGSGSGSDLREQFNFAMQTLFPQGRQTTLEPWEFIKERNGWPEEIHLRYRDVILQSTDQNKSGFVKKNEQSPTSDKKETKDPMSV
jgi:hypothetical protein